MKIAIVGLAGAGKDTFGEMLVKHLGSDWELAKYATPLKELTRSIFGDDFDDREVKEVPRSLSDNVGLNYTLEEHLANLVTKFVDNTYMTRAKRFLCLSRLGKILSDLPNNSISPRQFQQLFGTDVMRSIDNNFWVDQLMTKQGNLIITDARFENEIDKVDKVFVIINNRLDINDSKYDHVSEQMAKLMTAEAQLNFFTGSTLVVTNNSDLTALDSKANSWAKLLNTMQ